MFGHRHTGVIGEYPLIPIFTLKAQKYQYRLINTTHLDYISGHIIEDAVGDRVLKNLTQKRINRIDGSILSYCSINNSLRWPHIIKKSNKLVSVLCDIYSDRLGENNNMKKIVME